MAIKRDVNGYNIRPLSFCACRTCKLFIMDNANSLVTRFLITTNAQICALILNYNNVYKIVRKL